MSKGKLLAVSIVWLVLLGFGVTVWKVFFAPAVESTLEERQRAEAEAARKEREERLRQGGSDSRYRAAASLALDGFSGYAVLRSPEFARQLQEAGIRLQLVDDGADYPRRLKALKQGDVDLAVFTIDALVKTCAAAGDLPATIIAVLDETAGADAVVAYRDTIPNVEALDHPDTRFVLTRDSPSETLARVVMSRFQLDRLSADPIVGVSGVEEVMARYRASRPTDRLAYVLWEPLVTQVLKNERMHVVVDSSRFPSAIVDVLVASDDFAIKNRELAVEIIKAYFKVNNAFLEESARQRLVIRDAAESDAPLSDDEAARLVDGVWWKNLAENLAHMGVRPDENLPHIEDMVADVIELLQTSGSIDADPTDGNPNYLYDREIMTELASFRPGPTAEVIRSARLPRLTDAQWDSLVEVGAARAPDLVFARGTSSLTERSQRLLDEFAGMLAGTRYYVMVRGNASRRGNLEANQRLAEQRAQATADYLTAHGVDAERIRAIGVKPSGSTTVTFVLGEPPP